MEAGSKPVTGWGWRQECSFLSTLNGHTWHRCGATKIQFNSVSNIRVINVPLQWVTFGPVGVTRLCSSYNHVLGKKINKEVLVDWAGNIELLDGGKGHEGKMTAAALCVNIRQESWERILDLFKRCRVNASPVASALPQLSLSLSVLCIFTYSTLQRSSCSISSQTHTHSLSLSVVCHTQMRHLRPRSVQ